LASVRAKLAAAQESNQPKLEGKIEQMVIGDATDISSALIFVMMTIKSLGSPTVVDGFGATVVAQGKSLTSRPFLIPEGYQLTTSDGAVVATFKKAIGMSEQTAVPIERGAFRRGWLRYVFPGVRADDLRREGATLTVEFKDILGKRYTASS